MTLQRAGPGATIRPWRFPSSSTRPGLKVQIDVGIGDDPAQVNLQKHLLRALYLEYAYRERPELVQEGDRLSWKRRGGWWRGPCRLPRPRQAARYGAFQAHPRSEPRPRSTQFLARAADPDAGDALLRRIARACALCLVQLLVEQPPGRHDLAAYVRHLPDGARDPLMALQRDFPALLVEAGGAQKWWTLNLARLSASDRYKGLTPEETDAQLAALLQFEIAGANKGGEKKMFGIADFDEYLKLPASRPILAANAGAVMAAQPRANALYRGVVAEYQQDLRPARARQDARVKDRLDPPRLLPRVAAAAEGGDRRLPELV